MKDRRVIISGIHGNLPALKAVLADIRGKQVSGVYCIGGILGPNGNTPRETIEEAMKLKAVSMGQGERALKLADMGAPAESIAKMFHLDRETAEAIASTAKEIRKGDYLPTINFIYGLKKQIPIREDAIGIYPTLLPEEPTPALLRDRRILFVGSLNDARSSVYSSSRRTKKERNPKGSFRLKERETAIVRVPFLGAPLEKDIEFLQRAAETPVYRDEKLEPGLLNPETSSIAHYITLEGDGVKHSEVLYRK